MPQSASPPSRQDLDELMRAAQAGSPQAVDALIRELQPRVFCMCMHLCGDREEAEETVQDTLLNIVRGLDGFKGSCAVTTWVYTIARHACCHRTRKRKHAPSDLLSLDEASCNGDLKDPCQQPDAVAASREMWDYVQDALLALPKDERQILLMREREGMKAQQIADTLEITVAAVKSRLHRARQDLRLRLASTCMPES